MKPKKCVLLISMDEEAVQLRRFMLTTKGFRVYTATALDEACTLVGSTEIHVCVVDLELGDVGGNRAVMCIKAVAPTMPVLLVSSKERCNIAHAAEAFLNALDLAKGQLWESIRLITVRKRGPRKKTVGVVQRAVLECVVNG